MENLGPRRERYPHEHGMVINPLTDVGIGSWNGTVVVGGARLPLPINVFQDLVISLEWLVNDVATWIIGGGGRYRLGTCMPAKMLVPVSTKSPL